MHDVLLCRCTSIAGLRVVSWWQAFHDPSSKPQAAVSQGWLTSSYTYILRTILLYLPHASASA